MTTECNLLTRYNRETEEWTRKDQLQQHNKDISSEMVAYIPIGKLPRYKSFSRNRTWPSIDVQKRSDCFPQNLCIYKKQHRPGMSAQVILSNVWTLRRDVFVWAAPAVPIRDALKDVIGNPNLHWVHHADFNIPHLPSAQYPATKFSTIADMITDNDANRQCEWFIGVYPHTIQSMSAKADPLVNQWLNIVFNHVHALMKNGLYAAMLFIPPSSPHIPSRLRRNPLWIPEGWKCKVFQVSNTANGGSITTTHNIGLIILAMQAPHFLIPNVNNINTAPTSMDSVIEMRTTSEDLQIDTNYFLRVKPDIAFKRVNEHPTSAKVHTLIKPRYTTASGPPWRIYKATGPAAPLIDVITPEERVLSTPFIIWTGMFPRKVSETEILRLFGNTDVDPMYSADFKPGELINMLQSAPGRQALLQVISALWYHERTLETEVSVHTSTSSAFPAHLTDDMSLLQMPMTE